MADLPEQNFANHAKFTPIYHFVLAPLTIILVIWSLKRLASTPNTDTGIVALIAVVLLLIVAVVRTFSLKVQDRVIRLEEQLRLMRVLPSEMQPRTNDFSVDQLVAMRFASDAELPELAQRVLGEKITKRKDIKQQIRNWRADHFRV